MNNPFLNSPKQLAQHWRDLRADLTDNLSDLDQLNLVVKFWAKAPIASQFLDWDHPSVWPDPWELMQNANFDESSISLGMEYTLLLGQDARWSADRLSLALICLKDKSMQYIALVVDNKYILNLQHNTVLDLADVSDHFTVLQYYRYGNKTHQLFVK